MINSDYKSLVPTHILTWIFTKAYILAKYWRGRFTLFGSRGVMTLEEEYACNYNIGIKKWGEQLLILIHLGWDSVIIGVCKG